MEKQDIIFGGYEQVSLPELGIVQIVAKIDTGAYTGAIHCKEVKEIVRDTDGSRYLRIVMPGEESKIIEIVDYKLIRVRSSSGHVRKRYLINTNIAINGLAYRTRIGLTDRSNMDYEILIGRRFLRENNIIVDVRRNSEYDKEKELEL